MFQRDEDDKQTRILVIQCDSGHLNGDLIACARYRVYDERVNALNKDEIQNRDGVTHVLFIVNLSRQISSSFIGFQGNPWISSHIDDLRLISSDTIEPLYIYAMKTNISELFIGEYIHDVAPLLDTMFEQIPRQLSQSSSVKSLLDESATQEMPGGDTNVENEGGESEGSSGGHQITPELVVNRSAGEAELEDEVEANVGAHQNQPGLPAERSSLESSPIEQFPGKSSVQPEPTVIDPYQQQIFQKQEDELLTCLAVAQTSKNTEPEFTAYQENPAHIESVGNDEHQAGFSPQTLETVVDEPAVLPLDESLTTDDESNWGRHPILQKSVKRQCPSGPSGQCRRLYGCIQAAASRLEDSNKDRSTQRVTHLTKLIHRSPDYLGIER
jgi:hypothetical protein